MFETQPDEGPVDHHSILTFHIFLMPIAPAVWLCKRNLLNVQLRFDETMRLKFSGLEKACLADEKETNTVGLRPVARRAGVSPATTSYALQNKPGPGQATRERILRVAKQLGYSPGARMGS